MFPQAEWRIHLKICFHYMESEKGNGFHYISWNKVMPADTDVFRTSQKGHDVLRPNRTSPRHLPEDLLFATSRRRRIYVVLKTLDLRCPEDIWFATSWRRLFYDVLKTSDLRLLKDVRFICLEDVWFTTSWRRRIYVFLKTSDLRCLEDVCFTTSWRRL